MHEIETCTGSKVLLVNARALTAAKAAELNAKQRNKQKKKNSETAKQRKQQKKNSEISLSSNLFASFFVIMTFKSRGRSKGSKNLTSTTTTTVILSTNLHSLSPHL